jgi:hypothetical protein
MISPLSQALAQAHTRHAAGHGRNHTANPFSDQIAQAIQSKQIVPANQAAQTLTAPAPSAAPATILSASQNPVAKTVPDAIIPSFLGQPGAPGAATMNALSVLSNALQNAGIDPKSLGMVPHDDPASYPGGSYENHLITLNARGHVTSISSDLMMLNPNVAVTEIKSLLANG